MGVRAVVSDVDGTLTDGCIHTTSDGRVFRSFHTHDGLGHHLLAEMGVVVAWLSATSEPESIRARARMLRVPESHLDLAPGEKGDRFLALCAAIGVDPARTVYMGDDENDLPPMRVAGWSVCPADAHPAVRAEAKMVTAAAGGRGAFRELADLIREALGGSGRG
jgi:3-deoxy-D-manno-octulosonate 8-phosphate phosphatase (KDO 8-P phosphatase)